LKPSSKNTLENYIPKSEFVEHYLQKEEDPRSITAKQFYDKVPYGTVKLHKTTRAGATVSLCAESIKRKELFLTICRTNRNITKTAKEETAAVVGRPINVIHILRNSFCPRITERIRQYPSIEKLGFIPLPNCESCQTSRCPIREAYETPIEEIDGFSLTYAKLQSLVMSENKKVKDLMEKLRSYPKNIIFDEVQTLQEGSTVSVSLWQIKRGYKQTFDLQPYAKLKESSPLMQKFLDKVAEIVDGVEPEIKKLRNESGTDHHLKHLAFTVPNPAYVRNAEKRKKLQAEEQVEREKLQTERKRLQDLYPGKSWLDIETMLPERIITEVPKAIEEFVCEDLPFNEIVKVQEILINAIQKPKEYGLSEDQIIALSKLLMIVNSDFFTVSYVRGLDGEQISLQAQDALLIKALRTFISKTLRAATQKRVIFTTATFGSLSLEKLLELPNMGDYVWGDPMNTSSKLLVVADKSRISPFNFGKKLDGVKQFIEALIQKYGPENVAVCTMNKDWSKRLGIESTWYQSDETEGVSSRKRIWIFVGLAEKPINAKDHLAITQAQYHDNPLNLQEKEFLHYVSQKLRVDSVNINTYQAISRAKDPEARDRSVAVMMGARAEDVEKCLLWGPTRTLKPEKIEKRLKFNVEIQDPIGKPLLTVAPLSVDVEESLHIIDRWITHGVVGSYKLNWVHLKKIIDEKGFVSVKRLIKVSELDETEVSDFFGNLPNFFERENISGYVLLHDSKGNIRGVATQHYYENKKNTTIITKTEHSGTSKVQVTDWYMAIKAAVERNQEDLTVLTPKYFSKHVSSSIYSHLSEFFDNVETNPHLLPGWVVIGTKSSERDNRRLVQDIPCFGSWAPEYPRRFGSPSQSWVDSVTDLLYSAYESFKLKHDCFVSVFSFPDRKHPKDGGNPLVSTIFIDLDVESPEFSELKRRWEQGDTSGLDEMKSLRLTLMAEVLKQARSVVAYLKALKIEPRILLSGFKGVHIFVDFPSVLFSSPQTAKVIIRTFLEQVAEGAGKEHGCEIKFDASVIGDLSRLCRIPNSHNSKATKLLGRDQYAIPVTFDELMNLTTADYDKLCSTSRYLIVKRKESMRALDMLTKIAEKMTFEDDSTSATPAITHKTLVKNPEKLNAYERECTRVILTEEDFDRLNIRPCFKRVRKDKISLEGSGGHLMRIGAVKELAMQNLSINSLIRWFDFCNDYDAAKTEKNVRNLISTGYTDKRMDEYGLERRYGFRCETIQQCGYCMKDECHIYRKKFGGSDQLR
jgi:hypothetical protein